MKLIPTSTPPLFGWSLVCLGVRYNTQLGEQREQAYRAAARAMRPLHVAAR